MLARYGIRYRIVTDRSIRTGLALARAKVILKGLGVHPLPEERMDALRVIGTTTIELGQVCRLLTVPNSFCNGLLAMVIGGDLEIVAPPLQRFDDVPSIAIRRRSRAQP